jgi:hypothetical protein
MKNVYQRRTKKQRITKDDQVAAPHYYVEVDESFL